MSRGGRRLGAGSKPAWKNGKTKVIRVPETLATKILEIARLLDDDQPLVGVISSENECVTQSKEIDLSGIAVRAFRDGPGIYLVDLVRAGYKIKPERLGLSIENRLEKNEAKGLDIEVNRAIDSLNNSKTKRTDKS